MTKTQASSLAALVINDLRNKGLFQSPTVNGQATLHVEMGLISGKLLFTQSSYNGITIAAELDRALRHAPVGPYKTDIDWEQNVVAYTTRQGIWAARNWMEDPSSEHEPIIVSFSMVTIRDFTLVLTQLMGWLENLEVTPPAKHAAPPRAPHSQQQEDAHYTPEAQGQESAKQAELG